MKGHNWVLNNNNISEPDIKNAHFLDPFQNRSGGQTSFVENTLLLSVYVRNAEHTLPTQAALTMGVKTSNCLCDRVAGSLRRNSSI